MSPVLHSLMLSRDQTMQGDSVSALEVFLNDMRYINPRFTYLLTYLVSMSTLQIKSKMKAMAEVDW